MFDYNQLNCFIAVAEELHFGRAAARLFMTQPPLSRQIRLLEHAVGVPLFERTSRSVRLTPAGRVFLGDARRIVDLSQQARAAACRVSRGETGRIRLAFTASAGYRLVPELLVGARLSLPQVDFVMHEMVTLDQLDALQARAVDVGFMRPIATRLSLETLPVEREALILALPSGHRLLRRRSIGLNALHGMPLVMYSPKDGKYLHDLITSLLHSHGVVPDYVQYAEQSHTILALVRAGLGIAVVPASTQALHFENVEFRALAAVETRAEMIMAWRPERADPALERFVAFAQRQLAGRMREGG